MTGSQSPALVRLRQLASRADVIEAVTELAQADGLQRWTRGHGTWTAEPVSKWPLEVEVAGASIPRPWKLRVARTVVLCSVQVDGNWLRETAVSDEAILAEGERVLQAVVVPAELLATLRSARALRERAGLVAEAEAAGWQFDEQRYGPTTPSVTGLLERASRLTKREGQALFWVENETKIGTMFAEPWHESAAGRRHARVQQQLDTIERDAPMLVKRWIWNAREDTEVAVARSKADSYAQSYVEALVTALIVGTHLPPDDRRALFREWDQIVVQGRSGEIENPENAAYRRAGSCLAPCFGVVAVMAGLLVVCVATLWAFWGRAGMRVGGE